MSHFLPHQKHILRTLAPPVLHVPSLNMSKTYLCMAPGRPGRLAQIDTGNEEMRGLHEEISFFRKVFLS